MLFSPRSDTIWMLYEWQYYVALWRQTDTIHLGHLSILCMYKDRNVTIPYFPMKTGTYPLFSCMVSSLEKQYQLFPHDLVTKKKQHLFNDQSH